MIIDEVDYLSKRDVLYNLFELSKVRLILIANSLNFASSSSRIHSRMELTQQFIFGDYTYSQLEELL